MRRIVAVSCFFVLVAFPVVTRSADRGFFDSKRNVYGWLRHVEGKQLGETAPFTAVGGMGFLLVGNGVFTFTGEALVSNDGDAGGSLGAGRRFWIGPKTILGAGLAYETNTSPYGNSFRQAVLSLELFRGSWSGRGNVYAPRGSRVQRGLGPATTTPGAIVFAGNNLVTAMDILQIDETSMRGIDLEIGRDVAGPRVEVFLGYHNLRGKIGEDASGARAGARGYVTPRLAASITVSDDSTFGTNVYGSVSWLFGGSRTTPRTLEDKLTIPVERNTQVVVHAVNTGPSAQTVLADQGTEITVAHVTSGGAGGSGTFEDPFRTLTAAGGNTADIVYVGSGSVFNGEDYALAPGQAFLGEGASARHMILTDQLGLIELPSANGIGLPRPVISGAAGPALMLDDATRVSNFDILAAGTGILANNLSGAIDVSRVLISGGTTGIELIGGLGQFTFDDVDITDPDGIAFNVNGGIADVTYDGDIAQNGTGSAVAITNHTDGTIAFRSGSISVTDGSGLQFDNCDGTYEFDSSLTLAGGDAGVDIFGGSNGSFSFADATITNPSGTAFEINDGSASVSYSGDITQNGAGGTIAITNHGGTLTFGNGTIAATNGTGLQFNSVSGTYEFNGSLTLNGGNAGIDIEGGSNGTFSFANATITDPLGAGFVVNGGSSSVVFDGDISKDGPGATVAITNHSGGTLTFRTGTISATDGSGLQFNNADGIYNFNGNVSLNGGDAGIDILGGSAGTFSFANATISNPTGAAFNFNGGSASVTYNGDMTKNGFGSAISITNHNTGIFTFQNGTIGVTKGNGLQFNNADGRYSFNGAVTLDGGDAGIDVLGDSDGIFTFQDTTITNPSGIAFRVEDLGPNGDINFNGSIRNDNNDLIFINTTVAGSSIAFNSTGSNSLSGNGGGGIVIIEADGRVSLTTRTTIVDPTSSAGLAGLSVFGGSGVIDFTDLTVEVPNVLAGLNAGIEIDSQAGSVSFTNLEVSTGGSGTVGFAASSSNAINVMGDSRIETDGGDGILLVDIADIAMTFDTISVTDAETGFGPGRGITVLDVAAGNLTVGTTTIDGTTLGGIDIDDSSATVTFDSVDIGNTAGDGISVGIAFGNPGTVVINGGTLTGIGGDGIDVEDAQSFVVNNVSFIVVSGVTARISNSTVSGSGNTAVPFSCDNGGGNSGAILFNDGSDSCP